MTLKLMIVLKKGVLRHGVDLGVGGDRIMTDSARMGVVVDGVGGSEKEVTTTGSDG